MSAPVFYVAPQEFDPLTPGTDFELTGPEGHHAKVKRVENGERIDLADGQGRRALGTVEATTTSGIRVRIIEIQHDKNPLEVYVVQALAKDGRDVQAIETATELGATGVVPWGADRSIVTQSRRSRIPTVYDLHSTPELAELIAEVRAQGAAVFILHEQASERLTTLLGQSAGERLGEIYLVVGPEGGISEREVEMFTQAGASLALLGTEVLRSSTAGSAGLCAVNIALGRW